MKKNISSLSHKFFVIISFLYFYPALSIDTEIINSERRGGNLPTQYEEKSSSLKTSFLSSAKKSDYEKYCIETILLPAIRKISSHSAYDSYESFVTVEGTGYKRGMDLNAYWAEHWAKIWAEKAASQNEIPQYIANDERSERAYIEEILLPAIRKISSHPAYDSYESFVTVDGTNYERGMDLNAYWAKEWAEKAGSQNGIPQHIANDERYERAYIETILLPEIIETIKARNEDEVCEKLGAFTDVGPLSQYQITWKENYKTEQTILHRLIKKGMWTALRIFSEKGADLTKAKNRKHNRRGTFSHTPLECLLYNHVFAGDAIPAFELLIQKGNPFYNEGRSILTSFFTKLQTVYNSDTAITCIRNICEVMGRDIFIEHFTKSPVIFLQSVNYDAEIQNFLCRQYIIPAIKDIKSKKIIFDLFIFHLYKNKEILTRYSEQNIDFLLGCSPIDSEAFEAGLHVTREIKKLYRAGFFKPAITKPVEEIQHNSLNGFDAKEMWRLFVPGEMQNTAGWTIYENAEKGIMHSILNAFEYSTKQPHLSFSLYEEIHCRACAHFTNRRDVQPNTERTSMIRNSVKVNSTLNMNGFFELDSPAYTAYKTMYFQEINDGIFGFFNFKNSRMMHSFVTKIITDYNEKINNMHSTKEDKLKAIIMVASDLLRFHMYADGNTRTAAIILQRELIRNNFSPVILKDMGRFDGFSQEDLLREVYKGMIRFHYVKTHGNYPKAPDDCTTDAICTRIKKTTPGMWMPI